MDYGDLIRDAWLLTWRHRFLWVLGLFTGTGVGSCSGFGGNSFQIPTQTTGPGGPADLAGGFNQAAVAVTRWVSAHPLLVLSAVVAVVLLVLVFGVLSLIAQGGMTLATVRLGEQRPMSAGAAWRGGLRYFWRFLGLAALLILAVIVVVAIVAVAVAATLGGHLSPVLIVLGVIVGIGLILAAIPVFIAASVIVAYAQRAIVVDDVGPIAGIRVGWRLLRQNLGSSALIWLINLGLGIGAGIGVLIVAFVVALTLGILGVVFWVIFRFTAPTLIYIVVGVVGWIAILWVAQAIVNTFLWSYWTLAYLRLAGVTPAPTAV